eukprot:3622614-Pyramimonas_sp.AAC.1
MARTSLAIGADWLDNSTDAMEDMVFLASWAASVMAVSSKHFPLGGRGQYRDVDHVKQFLYVVGVVGRVEDECRDATFSRRALLFGPNTQ